MAAYTSDPIIDPDELGYTVNVAFASSSEEIVIDTATKKIALKVQGNLTTDGAVIKAVYSKLKDAWRSDATLIKFPFPMGPITDEQFEMVNGWNWDSTNTSGAATQKTTELLRTGGWSVVNTSNQVTEQWFSVVTLGTLGSLDQVYYQQVSSATPSVNVTLTGPVNQAVQIYSDPNGDGNVSDGYDRRTYFKIFVREWQKIYAQSEIADIGVTSLTYQAYRFPLTNSGDVKVTHTEVQIDANADGTPDVGVYANVNITYLRDSANALYDIRGDYSNASVVYAIGDVTRSTNGRWYKCITGYTSNVTLPSASANWTTYEGERLIGTTYYPFTVIIDGDTTVAANASGAARTTEIYESVQYRLRQAIDIDAGAVGNVTGKTATELLSFVGDTLVTSQGVYIDSYNTQDTNSITMTTWGGALNLAEVTVNFPFVAALTVNFGTNLQDDQYAKYWVFFSNAAGNVYGTTNAIIVQDNDDLNMTGNVNPSWPTKRTLVSHSFDYDNNVQGGRTGGTPADVTVVGIGLSTGQYVSATGTIARSTTNAVSLVAALERNYSQGTTYP